LIISKTPYRISFFGGGTDYPDWYLKHSGEVISTTIDKYLYLCCRTLPPFYEYKYRIIWQKIEKVKLKRKIEHKVVKKMIDYLKIDQGLDILYAGDLPAQSGVGSSSSFVVGLMAALLKLKDVKYNKKILAKKSMYFEQKIMREIVGSQDQIASVYGGFQSIYFNKKGNFKITNLKTDIKYIKNLNKRLVLVYTPRLKASHHFTSKYVKNFEKKKLYMNMIVNYTKEAKKIIKQKKLDEFGYLLNKAWMAKKELSPYITNSKIERIYQKGLQSGALGGKLLGAGGGGFILFYIKPNKKKKFLHSFRKYKVIDFKFSNHGSKILYNSKFPDR